jgi:D-alanyl-D-alanine carboxypeptidase
MRLPALRAVTAWLLAGMLCPALSAPTTLGARLDAAMARENAASRFDGVVLVGQGETLIFQRAIGLADRARQRPHSLDQPWRWASVSKQVTALVVMQQVERGRLGLDDRLATLLPDFKSPLAEQITVRQLLQHTSGLPNPDAAPGYYTAQFKTDTGPVDAALAYCSGPPVGQPGARFSYNNCDTLVLQAVLERLTRRPYAQLLQDTVAGPLQLSSLQLAGAASAQPAALAQPQGYLDAKTAEPAFNLATFGAGGALVGTAQDLWRFDRALMQNRLLSEASTRTLWQGEPKLGYVALGAWSFPAPLAGCSGAVALVERRGQIGGVQVRNLLAPALGRALIVFSNTAATEFGEIWQGQGLLHEMASAAFCAAPAATTPP